MTKACWGQSHQHVQPIDCLTRAALAAAIQAENGNSLSSSNAAAEGRPLPALAESGSRVGRQNAATSSHLAENIHAMIPGTEGYAEHAEELVKRFEAVSFAEKHEAVMHLLPSAPSSVLDVGAGTGVDAAWFASKGHRVVAVEPTDSLRLAGIELHRASPFEWVNDSLPDLACVRARGQRFDVVMLTAVWMHLDEQERRRAMPRVASLLAPGGVLVMSLRHGPAPSERRIFQVSDEETVALASGYSLKKVLSLRSASAQAVNRLAGVTWTRLAFRWAT